MIIPEIVGQILFLTSLGLLGLVISRLAKLEMTLSCLIAGVIGAYCLPFLGIDTGIRASNIKDLVFFVILPILIFEAAWHIQPALLKRWLLPIFLLATIGVLLTCALIAVGSYYSIAHEGFPWIAALLTGAILSATDPVAVVATLKQLNAPDDLTTLIEGESLFNDATAVVLFTVLLAVATTQQGGTDQSYIILFVSVFFGGIVVGVIAGLVAAILSLLLASRSSATIVLVFLAFGSFYIAEHLLHVSGIMAAMSAAITAKLLLREHETQLLCDIGPTWDWLGRLFTLLIFVLMGLVIQFQMFLDQWLAILIAIAAALGARAISVFVVSLSTRFSVRPVSFGWQLILTWGGLRGAIAIVLVLSLPVSLPYWWTIQSMVFGVVLFSLLVQGLTAGPVIQKYKGQQL